MKIVTQKTENGPLILPKKPQRIVSLVPSQTELLYDLGCSEEVVGITKFCIHPSEWWQNKTKVGGTKTVNIEKVRLLQPDLIIANKEENTLDQIEQLQHLAPVWVSDIYNLSDAIGMIEIVGALVDKVEQANKLVKDIVTGFHTIKPLQPNKKTAYFIWNNPYMIAGRNTFINDLMRICGFENIAPENSRYPEINIAQQCLSFTADFSSISGDDISTQACPEIILLSSEPYPFKKVHLLELENSLPGSKVMLADGEMFSWYGSRLLKAIPYLKRLVEQALENSG